METPKWYESVVGATKDEWYPIWKPESRSQVLQNYKNAIEDNRPLDWIRYVCRRSTYAVPFWLWILWRLLFPLANWLHRKLRQNMRYIRQEYFIQDTQKWSDQPE